MSSQRKKSFKVSFDTKVKTRTFQVESDMVRHQHIKQTKQKLYPNTYDCPKPKEADTLEAIRCAKSLSETLQASDLSPTKTPLLKLLKFTDLAKMYGS